MGLLRKILFPFSLIYGLVVYFRNLFFDWGLFPSKSYKTPLICVGNLSVGGTGKTPMVELLASILGSDYRVAILSRGYKRKSKGFVMASVEGTPELLGDEPYQLYSKLPETVVAVDTNRQNGIIELKQKIQPDIILLDDAFQHRKVKPGFSILLTECNNLYTKDWYLPSGNLRDGKAQSRRADIIVVTKCPRNQTEAQRQKIAQQLNAKPTQKVLFSYLAYDEDLGGTGQFKVLDDLKKAKITLVTGIANPKPLVEFLQAQHIEFEHLIFKDHHFFTPREIETLNHKPNLITTEKDFVRLKSAISNCNFITVKHAFFNQGLEDLKGELRQFMTQYS